MAFPAHYLNTKSNPDLNTNSFFLDLHLLLAIYYPDNLSNMRKSIATASLLQSALIDYRWVAQKK